MANSCSLDNILQSVLALGNTEQNQAYPPFVFTQHFRIVTSLLISKLAKLYPSQVDVLDMLEPLTLIAKIPVTNGFIQLPKDYRNILGAPCINLAPDGKPCGDSTPQPPAPLDATSFKLANLKAGCNLTPLVILPQSEYAYRTSSTYNKPTQKDPIGYMADTFRIQVCPFDLPTVTLLYTREEKLVNYGYILQPDDTYIFDVTTSVESEWSNAAFTPLFNAIFALYAAYVANPELTNFAQILKEII